MERLSFAMVLATALTASAGTVGYWRFEEASGDTADVGGTAGTMTALNGPGRSTLVPVNPVPQTGAANARSFLVDATDDVFATNGGIILNNAGDDASDPGAGNFTLETWVNPNLGAQGFIAGKSFNSGGASEDKGYHLVIDAAGTNPNTYRVRGGVRTTAGGFFDTDTQSSAEGIPYGEWHHLALVRDGDNLTIFVDGLAGFTRTGLAGKDFRSRVPYTIGSGIVGGGPGGIASFGNSASGPFARTLDGRIDEVRISDVALGPTQFLNAVPEPHSAGLLLVGMVLLLLRCRRGVEAHNL
jgi:hypothetical protein